MRQTCLYAACVDSIRFDSFETTTRNNKQSKEAMHQCTKQHVHFHLGALAKVARLPSGSGSDQERERDCELHGEVDAAWLQMSFLESCERMANQNQNGRVDSFGFSESWKPMRTAPSIFDSANQSINSYIIVPPQHASLARDLDPFWAGI